MKVSLAMLGRGVRQVGRSLLTPEPGYANAALANGMAITQERRRTGQALKDVWLEINGPHGTYYIMERSNGGGEYLRQLPPDTAANQVVKIVVPDSSPAIDLLTQLERMIGRFNESPQFVDPGGTHESLELVEGAAGQKHIPGLLATIHNIRSAIVQEYGPVMAESLVAQMRLTHGTHTFASAREVVAMVRQSTETLRASFLADTRLALFIPAFESLTNALFERDLAVGHRQEAAEHNFAVRLVEWQQVPGYHPRALFQFVVARAASHAGVDILVLRADTQYDRGRALIGEALDAKTRDDHGDALYRAAVPLLESREICRGLLELKSVLPGLNVDFVGQLASVAEEEMVKVQDALLFALRDRGGDLLEGAKRDISTLAGPKKAARVTNMIEQRYYFPRTYAGYLTGAADKPAE